jgi:hypothetical protein
MRRVDDVEKLRVQGEYIKQASASQQQAGTRKVGASCPSCRAPYEVAFASHLARQNRIALEERQRKQEKAARQR